MENIFEVACEVEDNSEKLRELEHRHTLAQKHIIELENKLEKVMKKLAIYEKYFKLYKNVFTEIYDEDKRECCYGIMNMNNKYRDIDWITKEEYEILKGKNND